MLKKDYLILVLPLISVLVGGVILYLNYDVDYCKLDGPMNCYGTKFGLDGFVITLYNEGSTPKYVQDITISKAGGPTCYYIKPEIQNRLDYYSIVPPRSSLTYFVDRNHPDGICLMEGQEVGETYEFTLKIAYVEGSEVIEIDGNGRSKYFNKTLILV